MVEPYKPIYTVKEAAGVLRVNPTKVYELISTKKLPSLLLGQRKIRGSDLERFIMTYPVAEMQQSHTDRIISSFLYHLIHCKSQHLVLIQSLRLKKLVEIICHIQVLPLQ